jgi:hypothetical protein
MNVALEMALDAMDSTIVIAGSAAVVAFTSLVFLALIGHVVMIPMRKTAFGKWAGHHVEAYGDRFRAAYAARKRAKAGVQ